MLKLAPSLVLSLALAGGAVALGYAGAREAPEGVEQREARGDVDRDYVAMDGCRVHCDVDVQREFAERCDVDCSLPEK